VHAHDSDILQHSFFEDDGEWNVPKDEEAELALVIRSEVQKALHNRSTKAAPEVVVAADGDLSNGKYGARD
jgi:hypothetical protein